LHKSDNQIGSSHRRWGRGGDVLVPTGCEFLNGKWGRGRPHPCLSRERRRPASEFLSRRVRNPKGIVPFSPGLRGTSYPGLPSAPFSTPTGLCLFAPIRGNSRLFAVKKIISQGAGVGTPSSPLSIILQRVGTKTSIATRISFSIPEGCMRIAQRFSVGIEGRSWKVPKGRLRNATRIQPSLRDSESIYPVYPTLKRWAIVECPSGTSECEAPTPKPSCHCYFRSGLIN
jgi:hypothetical protein